jgi:hypothetical protein
MTYYYAIFILSLISCSFSLYFFLKVLTKGLPNNIMIIPARIFMWVYFILAPLVNILTEKYVDEKLFLDKPIVELTNLNFVNSFLLFLAAFSARFVKIKYYKTRDSQKIPNGVFLFLTILVLTSLFYGLFLIYYNSNLISGASEFSNSNVPLYHYMFIESGPLAFCWLTTLIFLKRKRLPTKLQITLILITQVILILILSSSRGSRVAIISQLLFCAQIYSFCLIKFRFKHYLLSAVFLSILIPTYAHYKYGGIESLNDFISGKGSSEVVEKYNDPYLFIVGDLGRADIQAPLISRYIAGTFTPNYKGETYLAAASLLLPQSMRPDWLRTKVQIGAQVQFEEGGFIAAYRGVAMLDGEIYSSRIYGLLGESLINFGWIGPPLVFLLFGYISRLALVRATNFQSWQRLLTAPYFAVLPIYFLFYDFDNVIVQTVTVWLMPLIIVEFFSLMGRRNG